MRYLGRRGGVISTTVNDNNKRTKEPHMVDVITSHNNANCVRLRIITSRVDGEIADGKPIGGQSTRWKPSIWSSAS